MPRTLQGNANLLSSLLKAKERVGATIDIPRVGEVNFQCTLLNHLDENWRMKHIKAIIEFYEGLHILAGGLNSFDETDHSLERWTNIIEYHEDMGKPTPEAEVMRFFKSQQYTDAKDLPGECESVFRTAKRPKCAGDVQSTECKWITYWPHQIHHTSFVPGSYPVYSSKGTSYRHIVNVDITKIESSVEQYVDRKPRQRKQRFVKI